MSPALEESYLITNFLSYREEKLSHQHLIRIAQQFGKDTKHRLDTVTLSPTYSYLGTNFEVLELDRAIPVTGQPLLHDQDIDDASTPIIQTYSAAIEYNDGIDEAKIICRGNAPLAE